MNPDCVNDSSGVVARYSLRQNCRDRPAQTVDILDPTSLTHKSDSPDAPRERPESSADLYPELVEQASARGRVLHAFWELNRIQLRQPVLLVEKRSRRPAAGPAAHLGRRCTIRFKCEGTYSSTSRSLVLVVTYGGSYTRRSALISYALFRIFTYPKYMHPRILPSGSCVL